MCLEHKENLSWNGVCSYCKVCYITSKQYKDFVDEYTIEQLAQNIKLNQ